VTPYKSYGNGSAMRVSPVAWWYGTLARVEKGAKASAAVTHNHPEGIKGAQATAAAIFLARTGKSKAEIKRYVEDKYHYDLSRTLDEIRPNYGFDETCQGTVPEAIIAFLESTDFEDAIRKAISLGGDSDTLAAITGSIAEAAYGIPEEIKTKALSMLDKTLLSVLKRWKHALEVAAACKHLYPFIAHFDKRPKQEWSEGFSKDGVLTLPYCSYSRELQRFLDVFYKHDVLSDKDYFGTLERYGIEEEESRVKAISTANVELLLAMLTFYMRGDRFSEGFLDCAIQEGVIAGILKRLRELHS
jgi:hypothetical protein